MNGTAGKKANKNSIHKLKPITKEFVWGRENWLFSSLHSELDEVPFLIKEIVAKEALSLQVHPGDEFARKEEGEVGKTEMWYILDCEPDSYLYYGLKHRASQEEIEKRIANKTILEICKKVRVRKGEVFYLPAGIIHAIGPGIRLLEVQQNSQITYRIYDYERRTKDNQARPLHISQALQVSSCVPCYYGSQPMCCQIQKEGYNETLLVQCAYFKVILYEVFEELKLGEEIPKALVILEGRGKLIADSFLLENEAGDILALSQGIEDCRLSGKITVAAVYTPVSREPE